MRVDSFSGCCGAGELSQLLTVELICESGFIQWLLWCGELSQLLTVELIRNL